MEISNPPGWGEDSLSKFIDTARHNAFATFHNLRPQYTFLKDLDQLFCLTIEPLAKVSEKDREKSFPGELERIGYRFSTLRSFQSLLGEGFYPLGI
jgi:hypothetical protein